MIAKYDYFNKLEMPMLTLCTPNYEEVGIIDNILEYKISPQFNCQSSLELTLYKSDEFTLYDLIKKDKTILIQDLGYFIITKCEDDLEGTKQLKNIIAESCEVELVNEDIAYLDGTFRFYNPSSPYDNTTLMGKLFQQIPSWSFGSIDNVVANRYRTFDVPDNNLYNFLMTDVEQSYDCIIDFNPLLRKINVYDKDNYISQTEILITNEDLAEKISQVANENNIVTSCFVQGDNELGIQSVNPMGTSYIYNFDYYMTTEWMSQGLIDGLNLWKESIVYNQTNYSNFLITLDSKNTSLTVQEGLLAQYTAELENLKMQRDVIIANRQSTTSINTQINNKSAQISATNVTISVIEGQIASTQTQINNIATACSFEGSLTTEQLAELKHFVKTTKYVDNTFVVTDTITYTETQAIKKELFDLATSVLQRNAIPTYEFSLDCKGFIFSKEFEKYTTQLNVGKTIDIRLADGTIGSFCVLKLDVDYISRTLDITLGNMYRLNNSAWTFANEQSNSTKTTSTLNIERTMYATPIKSGQLEEAYRFVNSSLNLTKNAILSANGQTTEMLDSGLHSRAMVNGVLQPEELVITNRTIAFTDDNWANVKTAVGKFTYTDVNGIVRDVYGIVGDYIVGNIIIGTGMSIKNNVNTFIVDDTGIYLSGNQLVVDTTNLKVNVDGLGSVEVNGKITATSGMIGGWTVGVSPLSSTNKAIWNASTNYQVGLQSSNIDTDLAFFVKNVTTNTDVIYIRNNGSLFCSKGNIGGWNVGTTTLTSDYISDGVNYERSAMMQTPITPNSWVFSVLTKQLSSGLTYDTWRVNAIGDMYFSNIPPTGTPTIRCTITANNGNILTYGKIDIYGATNARGGVNISTNPSTYNMGMIDIGNNLAVRTDVGSVYLMSNSGTICSNFAGTGNTPITASAFTIASSKRYKDHIEYMSEIDGNKILDLQVAKFDYKGEYGAKGQYGLYAEDTFKVIPTCVTVIEDVIEGIDYAKIVPFLIKKAQMQETEIIELKNKINALMK